MPEDADLGLILKNGTFRTDCLSHYFLETIPADGGFPSTPNDELSVMWHFLTIYQNFKLHQALHPHIETAKASFNFCSQVLAGMLTTVT